MGISPKKTLFSGADRGRRQKAPGQIVRAATTDAPGYFDATTSRRERLQDDIDRLEEALSSPGTFGDPGYRIRKMTLALRRKQAELERLTAIAVRQGQLEQARDEQAAQERADDTAEQAALYGVGRRGV